MKNILSEVAHIFNETFSNVIKELKIEKDDNLFTDFIEETGPVLKANKKYKHHLSTFANKKFF